MQSLTEVGVLGAPTSPFSPNSASSSEFDTIDSFDVHPANRWTEVNSGFDVSISDGLLNMSDTGDGTKDIYYIDRDLRSLDGNIEVRFKFITDGTIVNSDNLLYLYFLDENGNYFNIYVRSLRKDAHSAVTLFYTDVLGGTQELVIGGDDRLYEDEWYILRWDYDILESNFRYRLYFDNGSKIWDYNWYDIGLTRPLVFSGTSVSVRLRAGLESDTYNQSIYWDYVNAPFKEREWNHYDIADDSDWLFASVKGHAIADTIDDTDGFRITIPQLDQWKGELYIDSIEDANWDSGDKVNYSATLYAVDYDNGDLHNIFTVTLELHASAANQIVIDTHVIINDIEFGQVVSSAPAFGVYGYVEFSMTLEEDRNHASLELQADSGEGDGVSTIFTFEIDLSDISSDSSQEFVLSLDAAVDISSANLECALSVFSNFVLERGESSGRDSPIVPKNTLPDGGEGGLFDWLFDGFKNIIISLGLLLAPLFVILGDIFKLIEGWLNTAAGVITNAIALIEGWLNTAIGFIQEWVEGIILDFIAGAQDLVEAILLGLVALLSDVWDVIVGLIFLVWDFLTLPDLLAIAAVGLDSIVEILLGAPAFILSVINDWILPLFIIILCLYWLWLVFLSFAEEGFEPLAGLSNFVERLLVTYDLTILGVGPLPIPIALFFIPLTYFMIIVPSGSVFAIW